MPEVSILIPTWNRSKYLPAAIESALAQTFTDLQVIVYNDGSDDCTGNKISTITDPRFKYVSSRKNRGVAYARNALLSLLDTPYGCWLDSDDMANIYRVELLMQAMKRWNPPFVRSSYTIYSKDDTGRWKCPPELMYPKRHAVATGLFRRECAPKFDNRIDCGGEDVIWELEMVNRHGTGLLVPAALYDIRRGKHKRVSKRRNAKHLVEAFRQSERWYEKGARRLRPQIQAKGFKDWTRVEYIRSEAMEYPFEVEKHPPWSYIYDGVNKMSSGRLDG